MRLFTLGVARLVTGGPHAFPILCCIAGRLLMRLLGGAPGGRLCMRIAKAAKQRRPHPHACSKPGNMRVLLYQILLLTIILFALLP